MVSRWLSPFEPMPTINKPLVAVSGDSGELLETSAMTSGARVRAKITFAEARGVSIIPSHIHPFQDEQFEVISGKLTYLLDRTRHVAEAGTTIHLPRGVPHKHYCQGPEDAVAIQTVTPGLDFDYLLEGIFGLGSEGRALRGLDQVAQSLVWLSKLKSKLLRAGVPFSLQYAVAWFFTPIAYLLGYRAVYRRFSGEEW